MSEIVGGLRARLIRDSVLAHIRNGLEDLGWMEPGRRHRPIEVIYRPKSWDEVITPNLVALSADEESQPASAEMGSGLRVNSVNYELHLYTESESLGLDLSGDMEDWLRGRVGSSSRPIVPLQDLRQATPPVFGYARINTDAMEIYREATRYDKPWLVNWFILGFTVVDSYDEGE